MANPSINLSFQDGALGLVENQSSGVQAKIGPCSQGTANQVYSFGELKALRETLGTGAVVDAAALVLATGGGPVIVVPTATSSSGTVGSTTKATGSTGTGSATVSGTPFDAYSVRIEIRSAAMLLTSTTPATFRLSLDAGITWGDTLNVPAAGNYVIASAGLTVTFANGSAGTTSFQQGDVYTAQCAGPSFSAGGLDAALAALLADSSTFFLVHVVGSAASASDTAVIFNNVDTALAAAEANYLYAIALLESPAGVSQADMKSAMASCSSRRLAVAYGEVPTLSPVTGNSLQRSVAWVHAARLSVIPPREDSGSGRRGKLVGATLVKGKDGKLIGYSYDDGVTPGMSDARFLTTRTWKGKPGIYATMGRMFIANSSDYSRISRCRVLYLAAAAVYNAIFPYLEDVLETEPAGASGTTAGAVTKAQARSIEVDVEESMRNVVTRTSPPNAQDVMAVVDRSINTLATGRLVCSARVRPYAYADFIEIPIGFTNDKTAVA